MADPSWDNGGLPATARPKMGTGLKVLVGCGAALGLLVVTCVAGGAVLKHHIQKDPEGFERKVEGWAAGLVQGDWDRFRALVAQLATDEGARAVYRAQPALAEAFQGEDAFLAQVRDLRPHLRPIPEAVPLEGLSDRHRRGASGDPASGPRYHVNKSMGTADLGCLYPNGARIRVTLEGDRILRLRLEPPPKRP